MSKNKPKSLLMVFLYTVSALTLIYICLHAKNLINIFPDKTAFFICFIINLFISAIGFLCKIKAVIKCKGMRFFIAFIVVAADIFIIITTSFFTYKYLSALKLIFMQICIKLSIVTIDNFKLY